MCTPKKQKTTQNNHYLHGCKTFFQSEILYLTVLLLQNPNLGSWRQLSHEWWCDIFLSPGHHLPDRLVFLWQPLIRWQTHISIVFTSRMSLRGSYWLSARIPSPSCRLPCAPLGPGCLSRGWDCHRLGSRASLPRSPCLQAGSPWTTRTPKQKMFDQVVLYHQTNYWKKKFLSSYMQWN